MCSTHDVLYSRFVSLGLTSYCMAYHVLAIATGMYVCITLCSHCSVATVCVHTCRDIVWFTGCTHQSIHPQYCLSVVFNLMRQFHKENPALQMKILIHFLKAADIAHAIGGHNVLFIKGPINDYKEEAVQLKHICKSLMLMIDNSISDPAIIEDVKTFSRNTTENVLAFIKDMEESPAAQHYSYITSSIYKIQLVLNVLQFTDASVKSVQSKLMSLLKPV